MAQLELSPDLILQGLAALFILLWAWRDARKAHNEAIKTLKPNPMVAAVSMQWDRDQQERLLQILERIALAAEAQAKAQNHIGSVQESMAETQQRELNEHIEELLDRLREQEKSQGQRRPPGMGRPGKD